MKYYDDSRTMSDDDDNVDLDSDVSKFLCMIIHCSASATEHTREKNMEKINRKK